MSFNQRLREVREGFESAFWVANISELFERIAFYGVQAVLAIYLHESLKFKQGEAGDLIGYFSGVVWFLPILGGTLADRYGFRRSLTAAYVILAGGYFLLGSLSAGWMGPLREALPLGAVVLMVMTVPAMGPAIVKPCVVGTTARACTENVRSLGYSIYYTLVNVGGMLGPLLALSVRRTMGIEQVFVVCAAIMLAMSVMTGALYREPRKAGEKQVASIGESLRNLVTVLTNFRFMLFLVIFSGFWIMFWQEFVSLPLFIRDAVNKDADIELLLAVDPLVVVLLQIPISYAMRNVPAFRAMMLGMLVTSLAWVLLAAGNLGWQINGTFPLVGKVTGLPVVAAIALAVVAMGELIQSPRFYEYVSRLAPPGQQGVFMGFSFLPIAIGSATAGVIGGRLVESFGKSGAPHQMWWVITGIGLTTTALMWVYDRVYKPGEAEGEKAESRT